MDAKKQNLAPGPSQPQGLQLADLALWAATAPLEEVRLLADICAKRLGSPRLGVPPVPEAQAVWPSSFAGQSAYPTAPVALPLGTLPSGMLPDLPGPHMRWADMPPGPIFPPLATSSGAAKPPPGIPGSGYTRLPSGKIVKNQRPKARLLQETQANNWHERASKALRDYISEHYRRPPKEVQRSPPVGDETYVELVAQLEWAKAYRAYLKDSLAKQETPLGVDEWRRLAPKPSTGFADADSDGSTETVHHDGESAHAESSSSAAPGTARSSPKGKAHLVPIPIPPEKGEVAWQDFAAVHGKGVTPNK